ncbi:unnamed protein product [Ostreobium quekettii]|uniref:Uncharacterized protein n=1 Tax=Ostreobium quekettii TaxID=121088 RepID=A0A8S1J729_9CHLO|nr:unnamed protein product [Ostreobium quekettii]
MSGWDGQGGAGGAPLDPPVPGAAEAGGNFRGGAVFSPQSDMTEAARGQLGGAFPASGTWGQGEFGTGAGADLLLSRMLMNPISECAGGSGLVGAWDSKSVGRGGGCGRPGRRA